MSPTSKNAAARLSDALEQTGLLLVHDGVLPSATRVVVGEPVKGSWWAHPAAHEIFDALQPLDADATRVKLVAGKVTLVHRRLWPELVAVGRGRGRWQTAGLDGDAHLLVRRVGHYRRPVTFDELGIVLHAKPANVIRTVERRLLIHSEDVHTDAGSHAKELETWTSFGHRRSVNGPLPPVAKARATFEAIVDEWRAPDSLPWPRSGGAR